MLSEAEVLPTGDLGELGYEDPGPEITSEPRERSALRTLSMVGFVLAIPITLIVVTDTGILTFSFVLFALVRGQSQAFYQLRLEIDRKYNAALLIEKRRTGLTISEIAERALREYFSKDE